MQPSKNYLTETILELLRKGHSVELPATGLSMFPAIRPGERVVVHPFAKDERPERGGVVVCYEKGAKAQRLNGAAEEEEKVAASEESAGTFVLHRLIEIREDDNGNQLFITRGDSLEWTDEPWYFEQLIGVAVSKKSGNRERKIRSFVPSGMRYKLNWWMLWGWGKLVSGFGY